MEFGEWVGIMVEEKSPEQLAEAIKNLLENFDIQNQMAEIGHQHIKEEFNISIIVPTILKKGSLLKPLKLRAMRVRVY